jgi:hypothetical protein
MQGPSVDFFGEDPSEEQTELGQRQAILDEAAAEAWATLPDTASAG